MATEKSLPQPVVIPSAGKLALPDNQTLAAFAGFILLGGGASVAVRITYGELPPFYSAAARFLIGALIFWMLFFIRKIALPRGKALLGAILFGALSVGLAFPLMAWGLVATPASTYQVLMALVPLLTLFLAYLHGVERIRWQGLVGSLFAVAGIAVVMGGSSGTTYSLPHMLAIIGGAACLAEAGVITKKFPRSHPIATNAIAMTVGTIVLIAISLLSGERWVIPNQTSTWIAFGYLVVFVTVIAFLLYLFVLGRWSASGSSYAFVMTPLVTMVLATMLADEQLTWNFLLGAVLVLSGVVFGALIPTKPKKAEMASEVAVRCV
jgi:drug/metabolite transporter (DMT)-like permease